MMPTFNESIRLQAEAKATLQQHTPGPWRHSGMRYGDITANNGAVPIASVPSTDHPAADARHAADARLIAAAPDLLAACRECLAVVDECYTASGHLRVAKGSEQRSKIIAAIAKAEGTS